MFTVVVALTWVQQPPIVPVSRPGLNGRGRDPWVFRSVFEDRTRMLTIAPAPNFWMVFNPETCAFYKIWEGSVDFRGKVWDFSQDNSRAKGRVLFASPTEVTSQTWQAKDATENKGVWTFNKAGATLTGSSFDGRDWWRMFVSFDETSREGRFRVDIEDLDGKNKPQFFRSATAVGTDNGFQFNFKRIERPSKNMTVKVTSEIAGKKLRNFRIYADRPCWQGSDGKSLEVIWKGYELLNQTKGVVIRYQLKLRSGRIVSVVHQPDSIENGWTESLGISGLPRGESVTLKRPGLSQAIKSSTAFPLIIKANGTQKINFQVMESAK